MEALGGNRFGSASRQRRAGLSRMMLVYAERSREEGQPWLSSMGGEAPPSLHGRVFMVDGRGW